MTGICDVTPGEPFSENNHDIAVAKLQSLGYCIRYSRVCPTQAGIPMTRQRMHYQGLSMKHYRDAEGRMDAMAALWASILRFPYSSLPVDAFLITDPRDSYLQQQCQHAAENEASTKPSKMEWTKLHARMMESYKARPRFFEMKVTAFRFLFCLGVR